MAKLMLRTILEEIVLHAVGNSELISGKNCLLERRLGYHPKMKLK
jgi:hypothetical protein